MADTEPLPPLPNTVPPGIYANYMPDPMAPFGVAPAASVHQPTHADVVDTEAHAQNAQPRSPQEYSLRCGNLVHNLDSSRREARRRARETQEAEAMAREQTEQSEDTEAHKKRTPSPTSSGSSTSSTSNHDDAAGKADLLAIRL